MALIEQGASTDARDNASQASFASCGFSLTPPLICTRCSPSSDMSALDTYVSSFAVGWLHTPPPGRSDWQRGHSCGTDQAWCRRESSGRGDSPLGCPVSRARWLISLKRGASPLHYVWRREMAELLLELGAAVDVKGKVRSVSVFNTKLPSATLERQDASLLRPGRRGCGGFDRPRRRC